MKHSVKLGENLDLIIAKELIKDFPVNHGTLNDFSTIGKMKDSYALDLFQFKNGFIELLKGKNSSSFYIISYSILLDIFRNPYMKNELRKSLTDFLLYILFHLLYAINFLPSNTCLRKQNTNKEFFFNDKIGFIKLINTVISVSYYIRNMEYLGLEHLSPHRAEQFFGQFRTHFTGNYDARYAFHFAICAAISLEFQSHFGVFFLLF